MEQPYEKSDRPYRRGLVLGLSLAELFLILLFLLLLASIGITSALKEEKEDYRDQLAIIKKKFDNKITEEDFTQLVKAAAEGERLKEENAELRDKLASLEKEVDVLAESLEDEKARNEGIKNTLASLSRKHGQDPACWFINVPDVDNPGQTRQSHVEIFNVKISDDSFEVSYHDNFTDKFKSYRDIEYKIDRGNIKALPSIKPDLLNRPLPRQVFIDEFRPFFDVGKAEKIRDYSCRFMVYTCDATARENKKGWKDNIEIIQGIFYTNGDNVC